MFFIFGSRFGNKFHKKGNFQITKSFIKINKILGFAWGIVIWRVSCSFCFSEKWIAKFSRNLIYFDAFSGNFLCTYRNEKGRDLNCPTDSLQALWFAMNEQVRFLIGSEINCIKLTTHFPSSHVPISTEN